MGIAIRAADANKSDTSQNWGLDLILLRSFGWELRTRLLPNGFPSALRTQLFSWQAAMIKNKSKLSSPRESHPEALPELYVSLSTHTAPMGETAQRCCSQSASRSVWRLTTRSSHAHARMRW